jgi:hypothetical protein
MAEVDYRIDHVGGTILGRTDNQGCAKIDDAELRGPVTVSLFPTDRAFFSVSGVDAARQTHLLVESFLPALPPQRATIEGALSFDGLPPPDSTTARQIIVLDAYSDYFEPERPSFGQRGTTGFFRNVGLDAPDFGWSFDDYLLVVNPERTVGLFALGGIFRPTVSSFEVTHLGVIPSITVGPNDQLTGRDFENLTALSETFTVEVDGPPLGNGAITEMNPMLRLEGGTPIAWERRVRSQAAFPSASFPVPPATGEFEGMTYGVIASRIRTDNGENEYSGVVSSGTREPSSFVRLPDLPHEVQRVGRTLSAQLPEGVQDFGSFRVFVEAAPGFFPLEWNVEIHRPGPDLSFTFPPVPENLPDPVVGSVGLAIIGRGLDPAFSPDDWTGRELWAAIRRASQASEFLRP